MAMGIGTAIIVGKKGISKEIARRESRMRRIRVLTRKMVKSL